MNLLNKKQVREDIGQKQGPYVRLPSSVTSKDSTTSSLVSSENGSPLVSLAHFCSPSSERYAFLSGTSKPFEFVAVTAGMQYLANMCFKQFSN